MKKDVQPIAIICLSPNNGGMEINTIKLAKKLSIVSDVTIIAKNDSFIESQKDSFLDHNNITLETIDFRRSLSVSIILEARKIVKKYNIKNVIFFGASELKSLYFSFLGLDINLIVRHGTTKSTPKKDWFHRLVYSKVNYHLSICKHLENNVKYIVPFGKKTKSKIIYTSFKSDTPNHNEQDKLTILHVGRIADGKGQIDALKACEKLYKENIDFVFNIVGDFEDGYKEEFLKFYDKLEYKDYINLVGYTSDVKNYIEMSDIFLFPSHGEGLSNAFLEAMSNNLIGITYDNTSFPELQKIGLYFKIVKHLDIEDLENKLYEIATSLEAEKLKSNNNNNIIKEFFSLDKEIEKFLEILV